MASESYNKGSLLSSTPIQSFEDSGYCGSSKRSILCASNVKVLNTCSPIKELSLKNSVLKNFCLNQDSFLSHSKIKNVLDYKNFEKSGVSSSIEESELQLESSFCSPDDISSQKKIENISSCFQSSLYYSSECNKSLCSSGSFSKNEDIKYKLFPECLSESSICGSMVDDTKSSVYLPCSISSDFKPNLNSKSLIIQKCGNAKVNFIHEFRKRNCSLIISDILSYLSAEELCRSSCVSKEWNEAILEDRKARTRKHKFLKEKKIFFTGPSKENRLGMRCGPAREHKKAFSDLTNDKKFEEHVNQKSSKTRFDSFIDEAKNGFEKLLKCPKCFYASKKHSGNHYVCTVCSYKFCHNCFGPVLNNHTCYTQGLPKILIGSRQSKKNLKRL